MEHKSHSQLKNLLFLSVHMSAYRREDFSREPSPENDRAIVKHTLIIIIETSANVINVFVSITNKVE